jgi:hypothetical protein
MSSSSATATASRSPSPATPESSDCSSHKPVASFELSSWYHSLHPEKPVPNDTAWDNDGAPFIAVEKTEEQPMLQFDDLIDEHAYDEYVSAISLSVSRSMRLFPWQ